MKYSVVYLIKIRWNCGTERYVTGYGDRQSVKWDLDKPAYYWTAFEDANDICLGLNINHLSCDLGGFACVVAVPDKDLSLYKNLSKEDEEGVEDFHFVKLVEERNKRKEEK